MPAPHKKIIPRRKVGNKLNLNEDDDDDDT